MSEPFDKRYDAWAAAEAEVYKALDQQIGRAELQAMRAHADMLLGELWGEDESSAPTRVGDAERR